MSYNMIRGLIITLGIFTVIAALAVQNQILAFGLVILLSLAAMITLYLNMETDLSRGDYPGVIHFSFLSF